MAREFASASSQYLEVASAPVTASPITIACWFKVNDITVNHGLAAVANSGSSNYYFLLMAAGSLSGDPVIAMLSDGNGPKYAKTTSAFTAGAWHHACAVFAADDDRRVYLDGGNVGTESTFRNPLGINTTSVARLGDLTPSYYTDGVIAELGIWQWELMIEQVEALAAGYSPLAIQSYYLRLYVPLVRDADQDIVGGLSFTAYNSPTIATHPRIIYPAPKFYSPPSVGQTVLDYERKHRGVFRGACRGAA